jgi:hypothetical protein
VLVQRAGFVNRAFKEIEWKERFGANCIGFGGWIAQRLCTPREAARRSAIFAL